MAAAHTNRCELSCRHTMVPVLHTGRARGARVPVCSYIALPALTGAGRGHQCRKGPRTVSERMAPAAWSNN
eukprot:15471574-Alexandrium_andersonii.AAC.1